MSDMVLIDWQRRAARQLRPGFRHPALPSGRLRSAGFFIRRRRALLVGVVLVSSICFGMVLIPTDDQAGPRAPRLPPAIVAPAPEWLDIVKPLEMFDLEASDLAKAIKVYKARRSQTGGGRQDILAFGVLGSADPSLRLMLYRRGTETYAPGPIFADLARLAAEVGLSVTRSGLPNLLITRFGNIQVEEVGLSAGATPVSSCSGFRLVLDTPALTMTGLACGGKATPFPRERLGCMIERLDLTAGGDDRALVEFFAATELKRDTACAGMRLGPDLAHAAWLDDHTATPRKNVRRRSGNAATLHP